WRAGESTDKKNILLKNEVCSHGRITRNPAN
ncbi:lysozyme, partial [Escherichia coli]